MNLVLYRINEIVQMFEKIKDMKWSEKTSEGEVGIRADGMVKHNEGDYK